MTIYNDQKDVSVVIFFRWRITAEEPFGKTENPTPKMTCTSAKCVKRVIQCLVVTLIVDSIFLYYQYSVSDSYDLSYLAADNPFKSTWIRLHTLSRISKKDKIMSKTERESILNTKDLENAQYHTESTPDAINNVLLLKTHKTASTTLQNVILRRAILHNLTLALPAYRATFFWPLNFLSDGFIKNHVRGRRYQTLVHHSVFNEREMRQVMEPGTAFITILREPTALFRSAYTYYNLQNMCFNTTVDDIQNSPHLSVFKTGMCARYRAPIRNLQAYDLGLMPNKMDDMESIHKLIERIDSVMSVVLITERFDESLLLLKKKFRWSLQDVLYFKQNAQLRNKTLTKSRKQSADAVISSFNHADTLLYTHFTKRLDDELRKHFTASELAAELSALRSLQKRHLNRCVQQLAESKSIFFKNRSAYWVFRPYGTQTMGYVLRPEYIDDVGCRLLALPELSLTHYLKSVRFAK